MARGECFGVTDDLAILYRTDLRTSYVSTYVTSNSPTVIIIFHNASLPLNNLWQT